MKILPLPPRFPLLPRTSRIALSFGVQAQVDTYVCDAKTGRKLTHQRKRNLVLDTGLTGLASGSGPCSPATMFSALRIGGGNNANSLPSGSITFTQVGTAITASAPFFVTGTSMQNAILKYGTGSGGQEIYITSVTSTTVAVATTAFSISASVATLWYVNQTGLQTLLYSTNTYQTNSGDNGTTLTAGVITLKRTFVNPQQAGSYTVNELGYSNTTGGTGIYGRIVLSSSDVVGPSNFYLVVMTLTVTVSPNAPLAVGNVGTGFNSAGNLMVEYFAFVNVSTSGGTTIGSAVLDQGNVNDTCYFTTNTGYTQQSSLTSATAPFNLIPNGFNTPTAAWVNTPGMVGVCTVTNIGSFTSAGQTCYGVGLCSSGNGFAPALDVKFTTPFTLPTGLFAPVTVWQAVWGRVLTN